jgi:hypothetical protein
VDSNVGFMVKWGELIKETRTVKKRKAFDYRVA